MNSQFGKDYSSDEDAAFPNGRVYVIDDDVEVLNVVTAMLAVSGYNVKSYNSPSEFLADSVSLAPGVVVTDQVMQDVEGIEIQRRLSSRPNHFKVILVTAFPRTSLAVAAMKYGAVTVLDKPFQRSELLLAVVEAFRQLLQTDSFNTTLPPVLPSGASYLERLSQRERDVILLVYRGDTNKSIGIQLGISFKTVEKHRSCAMKKLQVQSVAALVQLMDRDLGKG
ncbi:MAG TPA: response regulator [Planctomycetaceae bacterium]|nr:response regulator [Planctomycetaceae bacterium]HQZ66059.1 response regulator [Planctomycetaceae bacterium]